MTEKYQMSDPTEILSRLAGAKFCTKFDMNKFFWQLILEPKSQHLTGFWTPWGTFSYQRVPMGLCGAPITAQTAIDYLLRGVRRYASALMDDITVHSMTWDSHLNNVRDVLVRLREAGLTVNKSKCAFACNDMKLFGFIVRDGAIHCDPAKVEAVERWKRPTNKTQLKQFLGLLNFFHRHIDHHATIAAPLTDLLSKNKPDKLQWTEKENTAFITLKQKLMEKPILQPPNLEKDYKIYADANTVAISGVLMQSGEYGDDHVIAYTSRKLTPAETRYPIIELELLSIVHALKIFHQYIYMKEIEVLSDHRPLMYLNSLAKHSNRLMRWILILQNYNLKVTYVPGNRQIADALTRTPEMFE